MMVIDASAIVEFLMGSERGDRVAEAMSEGGTLFAPSHLFAEVASAIARMERAGTLDDKEASACMVSLERLPLESIDGQKLIAASWTLRKRFQIADAFYLACSLLLQVPLVTCDGRLARGANDLIGIRHIV